MRKYLTVLSIGVASIAISSHNLVFAFSGTSLPLQQDVSSAVFVSAEQGVEAENFVNKMAGDAVEFLGNTDLTEEQKQEQFRKLLINSFDMDTIARFSLGRYWRVASDEQRAEYQKLFQSMIVEVYSKRFEEYDGQKLDVRGSRVDSDNDITVESFIVSDKGQEIKLDWRVRQKNGRYKVIDVVVEGVSMALTQRSDFSSVIQRGGGEVSVLLDHLKAN